MAHQYSTEALKAAALREVETRNPKFPGVAMPVGKALKKRKKLRKPEPEERGY